MEVILKFLTLDQSQNFEIEMELFCISNSIIMFFELPNQILQICGGLGVTKTENY